MVDLVITATNVVAGSGAAVTRGFMGEVLTAGNAVYLDTVTNKWLKADNNSATLAAKKAGGIALNGGAINQALTILTAGPITMGATLTNGAAYYLGDTPGGICPDADVVAGESVCLMGFAISTTVLQVNIQAPGVTR